MLFDEDTAFADLRHATNLGDYDPPGWEPARIEDYVDADPTGWKLAANQEACAYNFKGELIVWVSKWGKGERSDHGEEELEALAIALVKRAAERGKTLALAICEEGQFQLYLRGFESKEGN